MLTVTIRTDNDAFAAHAPAELSRILRDLADRMDLHHDDGPAQGRLRDLNGHDVGSFAYVPGGGVPFDR